jgi:hypothetical protein
MNRFAARRSPSVAVAVAALLWPALAHACPACAGRPGGGTGRLLVIALMMLLPFAIAALLFVSVRRHGATRGATTSADRAGETGDAASGRSA